MRNPFTVLRRCPCTSAATMQTMNGRSWLTLSPMVRRPPSTKCLRGQSNCPTIRRKSAAEAEDQDRELECRRGRRPCTVKTCRRSRSPAHEAQEGEQRDRVLHELAANDPDTEGVLRLWSRPYGGGGLGGVRHQPSSPSWIRSSEMGRSGCRPPSTTSVTRSHTAKRSSASSSRPGPPHHRARSRDRR